jgi:2-polyprenyl-6-methoxyphenol hydroxylase-like FAD-dependent oxidoreductase
MDISPRYDVVIAGARVAGASTALLLARAGLRVLVVDPVERGRDTLSTHALMRGGVMQLARWGVLDAIRAEGTPRIESTVFHYGTDTVPVRIEPGDGVDGLYAPRRTVLDGVLVDAAVEAGAEVAFGWSLVDLERTPNGHVIGVVLSGPGQEERRVRVDLVVGADGARSRTARLVGARPTFEVPHATASIYGYFEGFERHAYHWYFGEARAAGVIPTNDGKACVFTSLPPATFLEERAGGLERVFLDALRRSAPEVFEKIASGETVPRLRGFAGAPSLLRQCGGPGWALVGDAGYFKDPLTAHGITDALRDAEMLAHAIVAGVGGGWTLDDALLAYEEDRDRLSRGLLEVTSSIASLRWSTDEVKSLHRTLSREMKAEVEEMRGWTRTRSAA